MKIIIWKGNWSFCLGPVSIMQKGYTLNDYKHEYGHHLQWQKHKFLYYFTVGIPSIIGWWIDVLFHRKWNTKRRVMWYYNQPWEKEADTLGCVVRKFS